MPNVGPDHSCPEYLIMEGAWGSPLSIDCERELFHSGKHKARLHNSSGRDVVISWKGPKRPKLRKVDG